MTEDRGQYCREVEAHLCRRNSGHLIRLVGPAFEMVSGWAARGIPLSIALRGIDRYMDRAQAKGPRRRPAQVQFCEADVLDLFDEWRRAVGLHAPSVEPGDAGATATSAPGDAPRHGSLSSHLERAIARLTTLRGSGVLDDAFIDGLVRELDRARASARGLRGAARDTLCDRLREIDAELLAAARAGVSDQERASLRQDAEQSLAAFRDRMPQAAFERALEAAMDQLLREARRLPSVAFD